MQRRVANLQLRREGRRQRLLRVANLLQVSTTTTISRLLAHNRATASAALALQDNATHAKPSVHTHSTPQFSNPSVDSKHDSGVKGTLTTGFPSRMGCALGTALARSSRISASSRAYSVDTSSNQDPIRDHPHPAFQTAELRTGN
jgi:transposase InsO family protein